MSRLDLSTRQRTPLADAILTEERSPHNGQRIHADGHGCELNCIDPLLRYTVQRTEVFTNEGCACNDLPTNGHPGYGTGLFVARGCRGGS